MLHNHLPQDSPQRPPYRRLDDEEAIRLVPLDGHSLEALGRFPPNASRAIVLCHPHPLYGGTMHNALIVAFARTLSQVGKETVATLRFNFRGVEDSSGVFDGGTAELLDVFAAIDTMSRRAPNAAISLIGYSFGSWVGLRAAWQHRSVERIALIAPALRLLDYTADTFAARPLPTELLIGDHDDFVAIPEARDLAVRLDAHLHVIPQADHFFVRHRRLVAETLLPFVAPELSPR